MKCTFNYSVVLALIFLFWAGSAYGVVVNINGIKANKFYGDIITKVVTKQTGDHHCSHDCKDKPTLTSYTIDYSVNTSEFRIISSKVECSGSDCKKSGNVSTKNTEADAWATFDVWGSPTTWKLSVDIQPVHVVPGDIVRIHTGEVEEGRIFTIEHDPSEYVDIDIEATLPNLGTVHMSPEYPMEPYFEKLSKSKSGGKNIYKMKYKGAM